MTHKEPGFTLLEILVAITIFGMVIGLAYSSYNASFHIIDRAESQAATYSKARIALERILGDLESTYPNPEIPFQGTATALQFTSTAPIQLHPDSVTPGPVLIRYQLLKDPNSASLLLYRSQQTSSLAALTIDPSPGLILCDMLLELTFTYLDSEGLETENWGMDNENEQGDPGKAAALPEMIRIDLRFNDAEAGGTGTFFQTGIRLPTAGHK